MIKKIYSKPSLEITEFKADDIIRTSGGTGAKTAKITSTFFSWGEKSGYSADIN